MTRISQRAADRLARQMRTPPSGPPQSRTPPMPREPFLIKLDDHLPAPTEDFEDPALVATTVTGKRWVRKAQQLLITDHYEELAEEDEDGHGPFTVVNRFPWVWCYKDSIIWVELLMGELVPRQPLHCSLICKTVGAHNKGATQAVNVHWGTTAGSETAVTGETVDAYNRYDDVGDDIWVRVVWEINRWELVNAEC